MIRVSETVWVLTRSWYHRDYSIFRDCHVQGTGTRARSRCGFRWVSRADLRSTSGSAKNSVSDSGSGDECRRPVWRYLDCPCAFLPCGTFGVLKSPTMHTNPSGTPNMSAWAPRNPTPVWFGPSFSEAEHTSGICARSEACSRLLRLHDHAWPCVPEFWLCFSTRQWTPAIQLNLPRTS